MDANIFSQRLEEVCSPLPGSIPETIIFKLSVKLKFEGFTLLDMYADLFPHQSKEKWHNKIVEGSLTVNGEKVDPNFILKAGWITQNKVKDRVEPNVNCSIQLLFENEDFIVVNKPSPLPMHPAGRYNRNSLTRLLANAFPEWKLKVVHRIDANTTGIVVLAKNTETAHEIAKQFENHSLQKEYIALVEGIILEDVLTINTSISKHKTNAGGREVFNDGVEADTEVKVVNRFQNETLLSISPKSGRTNQIRLHLASIGHPIVGDKGYKDENYFKTNPLTYSNDSLFLHAHRLSFMSKGESYDFRVNIPDKFKK